MMKKQRGADRELLAVTDTSCSVKRSSDSKRSAESLHDLQKKQKAAANSISSELEALSLLQHEQLADDKHYKIMQLSTEVLENWTIEAYL